MDLRESPERILSLANIFYDSTRFLKNLSFDYHSNNQELFNSNSYSGFFKQLESLFFRVEENIQKLILRQFFPLHHANILNSCVTILKNCIYFFNSMLQCDQKNFHFFKNSLNIFENGIFIIDGVVKGYSSSQIEYTASDKLLLGNFRSFCEELGKNIKLDVKLKEKNEIVNKIENSVILSSQSTEENKNEIEQKTDELCDETNVDTRKNFKMKKKPQFSALPNDLLQNSMDASLKSLSKNKQVKLKALTVVIKDQINYFSVCSSKSRGKKLKLKCNVCNISKLTPKLAERHVTSHEHLDKLLILSEKENNEISVQLCVDSTIASASSNDMKYLNFDPETQECMCLLCNVEVQYSQNFWMNHLESVEHKKNLESIKSAQDHDQSICEEVDTSMKSDVKLTGKNEYSAILSSTSSAGNENINEKRTVDSHCETTVSSSQIQETKRELKLLNVPNNLLQNSTDFNLELLSKDKQDELKALTEVINYQINYFSICAPYSKNKNLQLTCKVCNLNALSSKSVQRHVNCYEHLENLLILSKKAKVGGVDSVVTSISANHMNYLDFNSDSQEYMCSLCDIKLQNSQSSWVNHFKSKEHEENEATSQSTHDLLKVEVEDQNCAPIKPLNGECDDSFQAEMSNEKDCLKSSSKSLKTETHISEEAPIRNKIWLPDHLQVTDHSCDADFQSDSDVVSNASFKIDHKKSNRNLHPKVKKLSARSAKVRNLAAERIQWEKFNSWSSFNFAGHNVTSKQSQKLTMYGVTLERHLNKFFMTPSPSEKLSRLICDVCSNNGAVKLHTVIKHILSYHHVNNILGKEKGCIDERFRKDVSRMNLSCLNYNAESEKYTCHVCNVELANSYISWITHFNEKDHILNVSEFRIRLKTGNHFKTFRGDGEVRSAIKSIKYHIDDFSIINFDSPAKLNYFCKLCNESVEPAKLVEHVVHPKHYQLMLRKFNDNQKVHFYSLEGPKLNNRYYKYLDYLPKFKDYGCNSCLVKLSTSYDAWVNHFLSIAH